MASVIVVGKHGQRREVPLEGDAVTVIGRDTAAGLALGDLQVSRRHALLVKAEQGYFVKDLGSRNGVLLNKLRVPSRRQARIKNGDVLSVGRTTIVFKDLGGTATTETTSDTPNSATLVRIPSGPIAAYAAANELIAPAVNVGPDEPAGDEDLDDVEEMDDDVAPAAASTASPSLATSGPSAPGAPPAPKPSAPSARPGPVAAAKPAARSTPAPGPRPASARAPRSDTDLSRIPRALPAGAPMPASAPGSAEVLVLRALERAERERVFYRNLVLVLLIVMLATLVGLLAWAIDRGPREPSEVALAAQGPSPAAPTTDFLDGPELDPVAFARDVQPVLGERCASCHAAVGRGGGLVLGQAADAQTVATNLSAVRRFVRPGHPEQSALLLEPLARAEGGRDHGGGVVLAMASPEWCALRDWVAGRSTPPSAVAPVAATGGAASPPAASASLPTAKENAPPVVSVAPIDLAEVGRAVKLDASRSADPDGEALVFRWTLRARPDGSAAQVSRPGEAVAELVPDVAGRYVISVVVHDGRAPTSAEVTVIAAPPAPPAADRAAALAQATTLLLGQALPQADLDALAALHGQALVDALAARPELPRAWWQGELEHLALVGDQRPRGEPWDSIPDRLRGGRVSALDAVGALLVGQAWSVRHAGRDAQVRALLALVVGLDPESRDVLPDVAAAGRMFDGHQATFLGKDGASRADLVRISMADARTRRGLLARACERASGLPLVGSKLDEAQAALEARPADFWKLVAAAAVQRLPQ